MIDLITSIVAGLVVAGSAVAVILAVGAGRRQRALINDEIRALATAVDAAESFSAYARSFEMWSADLSQPTSMRAEISPLRAEAVEVEPGEGTEWPLAAHRVAFDNRVLILDNRGFGARGLKAALTGAGGDSIMHWVADSGKSSPAVLLTEWRTTDRVSRVAHIESEVDMVESTNLVFRQAVRPA